MDSEEGRELRARVASCRRDAEAVLEKGGGVCSVLGGRGEPPSSARQLIDLSVVCNVVIIFGSLS